ADSRMEISVGESPRELRWGGRAHSSLVRKRRMVSSKQLGSAAHQFWSAKGRFTSIKFVLFATAEPMTLNDLANLGQIIGALAVVISLFYVAHSIRQNTNAVRSATAQTVHEHFANWYHLIAADAELAQVAANGLRDYGSLSEQERVRFVATF